VDYLDFYNLTQEPFSVMPVTKFYYHSEQHDRALEKLQYAVSTMKGLAVLVGDLGTGKTTLARRLLDSLPEDEYEASLLVIIHSDVDSAWLLKRVAAQLGVGDLSGEKVDILGRLYQRLVEISDAGKKAVILIDEAQMLKKPALMEEFRGLLNLELPEKKLLSFVFFGLPELDACLASDPPLAQRVAVKFRLQPFAPETTAAYIRHRLSLAGADEEIFTEGASALIHEHSKGIPRLINVICDNALFEGYVRKVGVVDEEIVETVAMDLGV
jgi:type II secretory pathway predicted ATPase ExeA